MAKTVLNHDNTTTHLDYMSSLDIDVEAQFVRLSGIICTIGKCYLNLFISKYNYNMLSLDIL